MREIVADKPKRQTPSGFPEDRIVPATSLERSV
jgi:hypothetical protein